MTTYGRIKDGRDALNPCFHKRNGIPDRGDLVVKDGAENLRPALTRAGGAR